MPTEAHVLIDDTSYTGSLAAAAAVHDRVLCEDDDHVLYWWVSYVVIAFVALGVPLGYALLLGRFPHNTGYVSNDDLDSIANYEAKQNNTIGTWLANAGYYTAFHGKYVNSVQPTFPNGWSHWGGFIQTYDFYNASAWAVEASAPPVDPHDTIQVIA